MGSELISEINNLPINQRFALIKVILKNIQAEQKHQMRIAADLLFDDYTNDSELTAFSKF
jgi:hypothetical protein